MNVISPDGRWRWDGTQWVPHVNPVAAARQRKTTGLWIGIGTALAVGTALVVGVGAVSIYGSDHHSADTMVTYQVTGAAKAADITYETPSGSSQQGSRSIPLTVTGADRTGMSVPGFSQGDFVYISAQRLDTLGGGEDVTCQIVVNGKVISQNTARGGYSIATCQGTVPQQ